MRPKILYCHCAFARAVPAETKAAVLAGLSRDEAPFEAVPDLCEMAARRDPRLAELAASGSLRVAACYPRAVRWLFASAGATLDEQAVEILNMRTATATDVLERLRAAAATESDGTIAALGKQPALPPRGHR